MAIRHKKVLVSIPEGYDLILAACLASMERAATGKGRQRHADKDNQPLHEQDITKYSHDFRRDQITKKSKELSRLRSRDQIGELEDIIVYASVEWAVITGNTLSFYLPHDTSREISKYMEQGEDNVQG